LVIEDEDGSITITIPIEVIEDLYDEDDPEQIVITVTVTPKEVEDAEDEDGDEGEDAPANLIISENGELLLVEITITVGDEPVTEISAPITVAVSLERFDFEGINTHRLVALCEDGTLLGGSKDGETGIFHFAAPSAGAFTVTYVENLRRLAVEIGSYVIYDLAGNAETQHMDMHSVIVDGRTLLPLRFVAYALGAEVDWTPATEYSPSLVHIMMGDRALSFTLGAITPELAALGMDVPPQTMNDRTMVPLRFIAEFFGAMVSWDGETRTAEIIFIPYVPATEDEDNGYAGGGYHAIIGKPEDEEGGDNEEQSA
jgi:hypothetical protein